MESRRAAGSLRRISRRGGFGAPAVVLTAAILLLPGSILGQGAEAGRSLTLDAAVNLALDGNRDVRRARLTLAEAEGRVSEAWGSVFPSIDLTTSYNRNLTPPGSFLPAIFVDPDAAPDELRFIQFGADNVWSNQIYLEQTLFEARAFIGVGAAGRYQAFQEEGVRGVIHDVVTRVRTLYYDLLLAREQARLIERSVERVVQSLEETRALNRAGLSSDYDVLRLEVELANLEPQLRRAENEFRRMERELVTELDLPPGTTLEVQGALAEMNLDDLALNSPENLRILEFAGVEPPATVDDAAAEALYERARVANAQLQQASLNEELRNAELQVERSEYLPRLALFGSYDIQAQQNGSPDFFGGAGQRGYGRNIGLRLTIPIFTGFERSARVEQRRATLGAAQVETELAEDRIRDEVRSLLDEVDEARLRARSQALAVRQAERGFEIASAQYREGLGSQLELTDAEVALRQSEFNYAQAVFDYLSARARLDRTVGEVPLPAAGS
ncbi:MAG: TolC family protein [Gemmatimonadota bacterium]